MEGARILELVINTGDAKNYAYDTVKKEIQTLCGLTHMNYAMMKVILETGLLMPRQILKIAEIATDVNVNVLVPSTGIIPQTDHFDFISMISGHISEKLLLRTICPS
jgi:deoxyribose-phosphate aldolase